MNIVLSKQVLTALLSITGILVFATCLVLLLMIRRKDRDWSELWKRIYAWWIMVFVFFLAVVIGKTALVCLFGGISFLAFREYIRLINPHPEDRNVYLWAYIAIPIHYFWIWQGWYGMFIIFIPVYVFLLLPMVKVLTGRTKRFLKVSGAVQWGLMVTVFSISHAPLLLVLPSDGNPNGGGAALLLFLIFLTEINDVSQYIWGKLLGKEKVVPSVSPGKTWAGFLGGVSTTIILGYLLAGFFTPLCWPYSLIAGVIIGFGGFIGDIVISALKRDMTVKDTGTLIPGHGGIMDRVDSLAYTAPLFFHFIYYLYY